MAPGRHWSCRDNGISELESDLRLPLKEIGYSNGGYNRTRSGYWENERGRDSLGYQVTVRQINKRREVNNHGYRSSSSQRDSGSSGGGPRRRGAAFRTIDREPGELSSMGSDGTVDLETVVKETQCKNKKRKFSPIIWDKDNRNVSAQSSETVNLPPLPPPLVKSYHKSPMSNSSPFAYVQNLLSDDSEICNSEVPPSKIDLLPDLPDFLSEASSLLHNKESWVNEHGAGIIDGNDDYVCTRTVISSRWDVDSPPDESEISDYEDTHNLKMRPASKLAKVRCKKSVTPKLVEVQRKGSEGTRGRSSGSDERVRSSSRNRNYENDGKSKYMEIDDGCNYDGSSVSLSDVESDDAQESVRKPQRSLNMLQGCRSVDEFEKLNKINEGTYGVVYRAKDKNTGEIVALKKVKMEKETEGFPVTALREMNILLSFDHPSIVDVKEVVMGNNLDDIFMVMEYMEHDVKMLMETMKQPFSESEVKCLMLQLLRGTKYLHDNCVLHRDLKTSNLLFNNRGELKICDFGMARQYGSPLKPYTQLVVTLLYRAPEILLGAKQYSTAIDIWSLGCIMAELLSKEPLFNGKSEIDQLDKIFRVLGTPNERIWPGCIKLPGYKVNFVKHQYNLLRRKFPATTFTGSSVLSDAGFDLLNKLLTYDPDKRITAEAALNHEWFREVPLPKSKEFMPTFPALHAQNRRMHMKSPDPLEEQCRKEQRGELGSGGLFGV